MFTNTRNSLHTAALFAAAAGIAAPATTAEAAYVDNTSWVINVGANPIGCPGTTTVTAQFTVRKAAWGGPLGADTWDVHLYDADGGPFDGDDLIGSTTVTWANQPGNMVTVTATFEVDCIETDNGWCTIRGNAGTDDEGDPHEMYIYVVEPDSGTFWNNSWTSPKNLGGWTKYTFPLNCGCDEDSGEPARYEIARTQTGEVAALASFTLPPALPTSPPLEFFQAEFIFDTQQLAPMDVVILGNGVRANDIFGQLQVQPTPNGLMIGAPVIDPLAALGLQEVGFELFLQQVDPEGFGMTRIFHNPQQTNAFFGDGSSVGFSPVDGEIPLRPFDLEPPQMVPGLLGVDPLVQPFPVFGQPGFVTDNLDFLLPGQIELEIDVLDLQGQPIVELVKFANNDGSFDLGLDAQLLPFAGSVRIVATDAAGNSSEVDIPYGGCNIADVAEEFGVLDLADISAFIDGFVSQSLIADLNGDGIWDLTDVTTFIDAFTAGCP